MSLTTQLEFALNFTPSEKTISNFILEHGEDVLSMSAQELAQATFTSPATIVRLSRKLGLEGYNDFKIKYSAELRETLNSKEKINVNYPFTKNDSYQLIAHKLSDMNNEVINDSLQLIDFNQLRLVVNKLYHSKYIDFYGLGNSILSGLSFQHKMTRIHRHIDMRFFDGEQTFFAASSSPEHTAIVVSYSGETEGVINIARTLKQTGTPIIAITSVGDNRLSHYSDYILNVCSREKIYNKIAPFASKTSIDYVLDLIYACIFQKDYDKNLDTKINYDRFSDHRRPNISPINDKE